MARELGSARLLSATGGAHRQSSVLDGLRRLAPLAAPEDWVLVHDAARPCLTAVELRDLINALGPGVCGAILGAPLVDTIKRERGGVCAETVSRQGLWRALTPQVFRHAALVEGLEEAERAGICTVTDEAQAMERLSVRPALGAWLRNFNIKVTHADDLVTAARILQSTGVTAMRIGQGFDVHAFGAGNFVTLGGVRITHSNGLVAHSDGDVVIHALCDALLGALALGATSVSIFRIPIRAIAAPTAASSCAKSPRWCKGRSCRDQCRCHGTRRSAAHRRAPRGDVRQSRRRSWRQRGSDQHQGNHHRAPWIHRPRRGARGAGCGAARCARRVAGRTRRRCRRRSAGPR